MHFSLNILAASLAVATAVAVPAPEASVSKRAAAIPQAWEIAPASFEKIPEPQALHDKPQTSKDASKRDTDALSLEARQSPFNWILTYVLPYQDYPNTYYYLPYVYNTCFSFEYTNLDNALSAVNILNTAVYCYFFEDYTCGYSDGYTYTTFDNTPLNANSFQEDTWSSYICYGV